MSTFINFSNHPSDNWNATQVGEALKYGNIVDIPFPDVAPEATEEDIEKLANESIISICQYDDPTVMVQGEFTLTYSVVNKLKEKGITCLASCSERKAEETILDDGSSKKISTFEFIKFRKY